ncbi:MAG: AraC family transcriptional regulator [Eubacteriales bacterium]|nr:AraC family transcriptional regulator [Eubacteriales bacterium]
MIHYQKNSLSLGDNSEEFLTEDAGGLPFVCYYDESRLFTGNHIPWHWHNWLELNYLDKGSYQIHTPEGDIEAGQGELVFINKNILHAYDFPEPVNYYSYTFDSRFLAGEYGSFLDRKYFSPVLNSKSLAVLHIKPDTPRRIRMIGHVLELTDVLREEPEGYELFVREIMSRFFLLLLEETKDVLLKERRGSDRDLERMKQMLQYIYTHYSEPIGLEEIAGAADISPRECTRCFRRSIDRPPIRFLIDYRAQMAAMMLWRTDDSISSIAEKCGFVSDSYFGKKFRDIYGCAPRDYRKKQKK